MLECHSQWIPLCINIAFVREMNWDRGATAVEYGIVVAFIAAVIITAVMGLGAATRDVLFAPVTDFFTSFSP